MLLDYIGHYYTWANDKFRAVFKDFTDEEFDNENNSIKKSIRELVIHQITTNEFLLIKEVKELVSKLREMDRGKLIEFWKKSDMRFADKINKNYEGTTELSISDDKNIKIGKDELYFAYTDHSTFHRGQMLSLIREYGKDGINTDFYSYMLVKYS